MNSDRHDPERKDFDCPCGSVANCGQSDYDLCWYGQCRGCGETLIVQPEGCKPGRLQGPNGCVSCED